MFDKKEIMTNAWYFFNELEASEIEWLGYNEEKTFANCLKAAWTKAKEEKEQDEKEAAAIESSEEVKAFDWACKKLGVSFEMTPEQKYRDVASVQKHSWPGVSVWKLAMVAVKNRIALGL